MEDQYYFIGRGKLLVSKLDASGNPGKFEWLGNVPNLTISIESRQIEHYEKVTGLNLIDKIINNGQLVTVDFVVENFVIKNLVKFLRGTYEVIPAPIIETVTVYPGAYSIIAPNITQWDSLTDVSETTTYIEGVDYTVDSQSGLLFIPLGSSITEGQEVKPNYTAGAMNEIVGFADQAEYYQLFFAGLNLANELDPLLVDIYKFYLHPLSRLDLINPSLTQFQVTGTACYDTNQASEELGGRFLRIRTPSDVIIERGDAEYGQQDASVLRILPDLGIAEYGQQDASVLRQLSTLSVAEYGVQDATVL